MWVWDDIQREWLLGESIAASPEDIVAMFEFAERILGADWIDQQRTTPAGKIAGFVPTLAVVATGRALAVIEGRPSAQQLIDRLKVADRAAFAELKAMYLCCSGLQVDLEIEPGLQVGSRARKPDFRVRSAGSPWTYVEVAAPDIAEAREQAEAVMNELASIFPNIPENTAVDLFLRRDVTEAEVESLKVEMTRLGAEGVVGDYDVGFGVISVNMSHPSMMVPREFGEEPYTPRLGLARAQGQGGSPATKRVSVRYPYSDERAEEFLTREARQLSRDQPGLIMLSLSSSPGSFKTWRPLLVRRLQPTIHTRVSAICPFTTGIETTPAGQDSITHTSLIDNAYALNRLPEWLRNSLNRFAAA